MALSLAHANANEAPEALTLIQARVRQPEGACMRITVYSLVGVHVICGIYMVCFTCIIVMHAHYHTMCISRFVVHYLFSCTLCRRS